MRKIIFTFWVLFYASTCLLSQDIASNYDETAFLRNYSENKALSQSSTSDSALFQLVYICTGNDAYAFHSTNNCPGLNNCRASVLSLDHTTAINSYNRIPCCRCWTGVERCHDDNPSGGGGGGGTGSSAGMGYVYIAIAAAVVAVGVVLISNEFYASQATSFYRPRRNGQPLIRSDIGVGGLFQFRKNFGKDCALEYGMSVFRYYDTPSKLQPYSSSRIQFGGQISFVYNLFNKKMPTDRMRFFVGPTLKWVNSFGAGGIVGVSYQLTDWLRADFRYELTNQSNHFQIGLSFLYQKKYFWLKKNRR